MRVLVGRTPLTPSFKPPPGITYGHIRGVSDIFISNRWGDPNSPASPGFDWDVAVLKLSSPVTGITPMRIPLSTDNSYEEPGTMMTVAGWGRPSEGGVRSNNLREAEVPILSDAVAANNIQFFAKDHMIAAGGRGVGVCKGDSGGPLFVARPLGFAGKRLGNALPGIRPLSYYQYGIFSHYYECGGRYPEVYTEVNERFIRAFIVGSAAQ
jgi:hypothetical protein